MQLSSIVSQNAAPTFGKMVYRGQHAYFLHKIENYLQSQDSTIQLYEVAARKGVRVLGFKVVTMLENKMVDGSVQQTLVQKDQGLNSERSTRYFLVKCMASKN